MLLIVVIKMSISCPATERPPLCHLQPRPSPRDEAVKISVSDFQHATEVRGSKIIAIKFQIEAIMVIRAANSPSILFKGLLSVSFLEVVFRPNSARIDHIHSGGCGCCQLPARWLAGLVPELH
jgi:hypothetical protein